jgi:hypothetical protein
LSYLLKCCPFRCRVSSGEKAKLVEIFRRVLQSIKDLLGKALSGIEKDISLKDGSSRLELLQESLQVIFQEQYSSTSISILKQFQLMI